MISPIGSQIGPQIGPRSARFFFPPVVRDSSSGCATLTISPTPKKTARGPGGRPPGPRGADRHGRARPTDRPAETEQTRVRLSCIPADSRRATPATHATGHPARLGQPACRIARKHGGGCGCISNRIRHAGHQAHSTHHLPVRQRRATRGPGRASRATGASHSCQHQLTAPIQSHAPRVNAHSTPPQLGPQLRPHEPPRTCNQ